MPDAIDLLLVYLLVLLCLIEMSAGVVAFCTLGRKSPKSRQTCRLALVVAMAAAAAGTAAYVTLGIRTGMIDLSPPPRGRLASEIRATAQLPESAPVNGYTEKPVDLSVPSPLVRILTTALESSAKDAGRDTRQVSAFPHRGQVLPVGS